MTPVCGRTGADAAGAERRQQQQPTMTRDNDNDGDGNDTEPSVTLSEVRRQHRHEIERSVGCALRRCADYVESVSWVSDGAPPGGRTPTGSETVRYGFWVEVCEGVDDLTPPTELPSMGHERVVYDLRPVCYADVRELVEADREGDEERAEEVAERIKGTAAAMTAGPGSLRSASLRGPL